MYATPQESYVYNTLLQPAGVQPVWRQVQLTEAILELVRAGLGVSVLPRWVVQPYLQPLGLCGVRIGPRGFLRGWSAVVPRGLARTDYVLEFLRLIGSCAPVRREHVTSEADSPSGASRRLETTGLGRSTAVRSSGCR